MPSLPIDHHLRRFGPWALSRVVAAVGSLEAQEQARSFHLDVQERTLDNGLQVLVLERENHPGRVAARIFYRSNIAGERPGTVGLTHMLEHHLFKGSHFLGTTGWEPGLDEVPC